MVVAPGRMIDSFLSIPDAESLPLYRGIKASLCEDEMKHQTSSANKNMYDLCMYMVPGHRSNFQLDVLQAVELFRT
jgi:hypothetical protein